MKLSKTHLSFGFGILFSFFFIFALVADVFMAQEKTEARSYTVPNAGLLELNVPTSWKQYGDPLGDFGRENVTFGFGPKFGEEFLISIFAAFNSSKNKSPVALLKIKQGFEDLIRTEILPNSEENHLPLQEIRGPQVTGYYVVSTIKEGKELVFDRFKTYIKAIVLVNRLLVIFDIGLIKKGGAIEYEVLELIRNARNP